MATPNASLSIKYSHTLWSPSDTVKDVAEVLGISNLPDDVAKSLAMEVEYRIHEVVEQAMKSMRHSRRTTLTTNDISHALRVLNVEPLYGYQTNRTLTYKEAKVGPGQTLYYIDDDEVDFEKIINQPLPKVPRAVNFTAHWLAIEGVQPSIPQNPLPSEVRALPPQVRGSQKSHSVSTLATDVEVKPLVKHVISKELQLYFDRVVEALITTPDDSAEANTASLRNIALNSLRNDPGLHQLVPYIVQFVQEQLSENLKSNVDIVHTMLEVIHAIISNDTIHIEPYIHQIMPCLLTPLLSKKVGSSSSTSDPKQSFAIRDFAASLLNKICDTYSDTYYSLKPRVTRTLLKGFMDPNRSVPSWYGAIIGIKGLGPDVIRVVILGNVKAWFEGIMPRIQSQEDKDTLSKAIISALKVLKKQSPALLSKENSPEPVPLTDEETEKLKKQVGDEVYELLKKESDFPDIARGIIA